MSRLWILPVCLTLAGCGGGGGSSVSTWLKSEPAPADKTSQQIAQLGASDIPALPRIQMAANTSAPGVTTPKTAGNQSLPAVDMSKSWSTSVEAAPLEDLPPLPTSGSAPAVTSPAVVTAPVVEASDIPSVKDSPVLPSVGATGTGSLPGLPAVNVTATAPKVAQPPKAVVFPDETATVVSSSTSVSDPYADRTAAYLATQKPTPSVTTSAVKTAALPSITPAVPQAVATASVGSVQSETLVPPAIVKEAEPKVLARQEEKSPVTPAASNNGKRYLVFASFNEAAKAKNLARRHTKLGATVLTSEVGGAQVYRVAVPIGKSAANKRRDLAAVGLTDAWPLRM